MKKQIYVIENNFFLQESISSLLEKASHYCFRVNNGVEPVTVPEKEKADLVISDIMLSGQSGFGLFENLQNNSGTNTFPFILRKDNSDTINITKEMNLGIDNCTTNSLMQAPQYIGVISNTKIDIQYYISTV